MIRIVLIAALCGALSFGCGDEDADGTDADVAADTATGDVLVGDGDTGGPGDTAADADGSVPGDATGGTSKAFNAAAGGTMNSATGLATLMVPPGALSTDTTLTAMELPKASDTASGIVDLGPSGTKFSKPATVCVDSNAASATPSGMMLSVARRDAAGGAWTTLATSAGDGGMLCGTTDHFSQFTLIFQTSEGPAACADYAGFAACGGDFIGTWTYADACSVEPLLGPTNPPLGCQDFEVTLMLDVEGTAEFSQTTLTTTLSSFSIQSTLEITLSSCPQSFTCSELEAGLNKDEPGGVCTEPTSGVCKCTSPVQAFPPGDPKVSTYTQSGASLTLEAGDIMEFCVNGDTMKVRSTDSKARVTFYTLTKTQ